MEQSKIDLFIMSNRDYYDISQIQFIKAKLEDLPDEKATGLMSLSLRNPTMMLIISILFGELGVDRFLLGETGLGILKLLTCGGCGIWAIIDWFLVKEKTQKYNMQKFNEALLML